MIRTNVLLMCLLISAAPLAGASDASTLVVAVVHVEAAAVVAWASGPVADGYRVYGVLETGAYALLAEVGAAETAAVVPGDYDAYAVAPLVDGQESPRVYGGTEYCVQIDRTPPSVGIRVVECVMEIVGGVEPA